MSPRPHGESSSGPSSQCLDAALVNDDLASHSGHGYIEPIKGPENCETEKVSLA
jgi:hypothetical protein